MVPWAGCLPSCRCRFLPEGAGVAAVRGGEGGFSLWGEVFLPILLRRKGWACTIARSRNCPRGSADHKSLKIAYICSAFSACDIILEERK